MIVKMKPVQEYVLPRLLVSKEAMIESRSLRKHSEKG